MWADVSTLHQLSEWAAGGHWPHAAVNALQQSSRMAMLSLDTVLHCAPTPPAHYIAATSLSVTLIRLCFKKLLCIRSLPPSAMSLLALFDSHEDELADLIPVKDAQQC